MNKDELLKASFAANMARLHTARATGEAIVWERTPPQPSMAAPGDLTDKRVEAVLVRLALSGRVSPIELTGAVSVADRQRVLNQVVDQCVVEADSTQVRWQLQQPKRVEVLQALLDKQQLTAELARPLPTTDLFGEQLRVLLRAKGNVPTQGLPHAQLLALMEAMEATKMLSLPQPDWTALRQQIGFHNFRSDQRLLLANGLVGRKKELAQLSTLLTLGTPVGPMLWRGLVVHGMGGSGKSTLLAKFIDDVLVQQTATLVLFDFDRPGLNPNDTLWLESEMARQIGYQYPNDSEYLRHQRSLSRELAKQGSQETSESAFNSEKRGMLSTIRRVLHNPAASPRPLLLLLDTFEEVTQQNLTDNVLQWLYSLADQLMPIPVLVILSGRLYGDNDDPRIDPASELGRLCAATGQPPLTLAELNRTEANQLLKRLNVPPATARRIGQLPAVARQPLTLKLLARLVAEQGETILDDIEQDIRTGGGAANALFVGMVYKRALQRMGKASTSPIDQLTQQLAYPGLWLRFATADLILNVLAPVLGLSMTRAEAEQALDQLTRYKWICYRETDGRVWHRRDLRRAMLLAMRAEDSDKARRLSDSTITYLMSQDAARTDTRLQAEIIYHRLLWLQKPNEGASLDLMALKAAAPLIDSDKADLSPSAKVLLEYARKGYVNPAKNELLPFKYAAKAYHRAGQRLVSNREFGQAMQHFLKRRGSDDLDDRSVPLNGWELDTLFATVNWHLFSPYFEADRDDKGQETLFGDRLYVAALTQPNWSVQEQTRLRKFLALYAEPHRIVWKAIPSDLQQYAKRLCMVSTLLMGAAGKLTLTQDQVKQWVRNLRGMPHFMTSAHFTRKLLYLELLVPNEFLSLTLAPSVLKIDRLWLNKLMTTPWMAAQSGQRGKLLRQRIFDARAILTPKTVRHTLDSLDALYRDRFDARVQGDPATLFATGEDLLHWFRGPDSEFRDPTRFALLDAFCCLTDYEALASLLSEVLPMSFPDLDPVSFARAMEINPEHHLEPYIELVDRTWALGTLLSNAVAARPNADRLQQVKAAHQRWDAAVTAAFRQWKSRPTPTQS